MITRYLGTVWHRTLTTVNRCHLSLLGFVSVSQRRGQRVGRPSRVHNLLGLIPEHFHTLTVLPLCPLVSFLNAPGLFSYPGMLRRDWQPVGPLHNRQAADKGRTAVRFLVLAGNLCFEFSRSPCGLTQGWWEFESSVSDRFSPSAGHACSCFFFFLFCHGEGGEKKQGGRRQREIERGESGCVEMWLMCQKFLIPPTNPNAPLLDPGKLSWTDSDIKTQTCSGGIKWVTAEKQINVAKRQDSLGTSQRS